MVVTGRALRHVGAGAIIHEPMSFLASAINGLGSGVTAKSANAGTVAHR